MSQIEIAKLNAYYVIGDDPDGAAIAKLNAYYVLAPGDEAPVAKQAHVYAQKIRRG